MDIYRYRLILLITSIFMTAYTQGFLYVPVFKLIYRSTKSFAKFFAREMFFIVKMT